MRCGVRWTNSSSGPTRSSTRSAAEPAAGGRAREDGPIETTRIDQWLWAVRLCRTRATAADACRGGHVRVNGKMAKPATPVRVGDRVEAFLARRERIVEVSEVIKTRVGAPIAAGCFVDHSPTPPSAEHDEPVFRRDPGAGRPTKRDRRQLDRLRGRSDRH